MVYDGQQVVGNAGNSQYLGARLIQEEYVAIGSLRSTGRHGGCAGHEWTEFYHCACLRLRGVVVVGHCKAAAVESSATVEESSIRSRRNFEEGMDIMNTQCQRTPSHLRYRIVPAEMGVIEPLAMRKRRCKTRKTQRSNKIHPEEE